MTDLFSQILNMSLTGSVVILCVMAARLLLKRSPKVFSYALWAVVLFRLLCPVSLSAAVSVLEWTDAEVMDMTGPEVTRIDGIATTVSYIPAVNTPAEDKPVTRPTQAAEPEKAPVSAMTIAPYVWAVGVGIMVLYSVVTYLRLYRRLIGAVRLRGGVYLADHITSPFVLGVLRPKIYLPSSTPAEERHFILAHERHHIRRGDHIVKLLAYGALCVHWFNPLVWAAFLLAGKDMEMSCDEAVIKKLGPGIRADYSASLLRLATHQRIIAGTPLAFGEGDTKGRILNMAKWKKPKIWVSVVCVLLCAVVLVACAVNPSKEESGEPSLMAETEGSPFQMGRLPEGYFYGFDENQNIIFTDGADTVGGVVKYPIPEGVYDPDDDYFFWLEEVGIPDFEDSSLCYTGGITGSGGGWVAEFESDVPEGTEPTVHRRHSFRVAGDTVYDIWFDMLLIDYDTLQEIERTVKVSDIVETTPSVSIVEQNGPTSVGFGDLYFTLPAGYALETEEIDGQEDLYDIFFTDGTDIIGGVQDYPTPEFDLIMSKAYDLSQWNFEEWLAALGLEDAQDEGLAHMGGNAAYGDYEIEYWSDVPEGQEITVNRSHTFFITEERVYDVWFDMNVTNSATRERLLKTAYTDQEGAAAVAAAADEEAAALERCRAVLEMVQSGSCQLAAEHLNGSDTHWSEKQFFQSGENWMMILDIDPETEDIADGQEWSARLAYMSVNGARYSNEGLGGNAYTDINWAENESFNDSMKPWLAGYQWNEDNVVYQGCLSDDEGECVMLRIDEHYAGREDYSPHYFVNFNFDTEGNFLNAKVTVNLFEENEFMDIESIVTLDDAAVAAEIDKEYQRAIS